MRFSTRFKAVISVQAVLLFSLCASASIFQVAPSYPTGTAPTDVAVGDVNGDTIPDLLVASHGGVDVLLGIGDGKFQPAIETALFSRPSSLAVGDFNNDGILDLIALEPDAALVESFLGDGTGRFQEVSRNSSSEAFTAITLGDFNGDGYLDAVVARLSSLVFLRGVGGGSFLADVTFGGVVGIGGHALVSADFNGDGVLDLAGTFDPSIGVGVFLGYGNGTFQPGVAYAIDTPVSLAVGDLNLDGIADLAITGGSYYEATMYGNGDGTFRNPLFSGAGLALHPSAIRIADFDGNGVPEVAVANGFGGRLQNENNITLLTGTDGWYTFYYSSYGAGLGTAAFAISDFNGDGRLDMAVANQSSDSVSVLLAKPNGFHAVTEYNEDSTVLGGAVGDFNKDGNLDVLTTGLSMQAGLGDGTLKPNSRDSPLAHFHTMVPADINHDGNLDVVSADLRNNGNAMVSVTFGTALGSFPAAYHIWLSFKGLQVPYLADLNHDGELDIVLAGTGVGVMLGDGHAYFGAPTIYPVPGGSSGAAIGDFDHDRKLDVVAVSKNSTFFLKGNGDGSFQPATFVTKATGSIVAADFNNDGNLDFAIGGVDSNSQNAVMIYLGNGKGKFHAPVNNEIQYLAGPIVAADFNGDGNIDVAVADTQSFVLTALVGKGDGTFSSAQVFPAGYGPLQLLTGDFNNDGLADVAIIGNPTVSILLGNGN